MKTKRITCIYSILLIVVALSVWLPLTFADDAPGWIKAGKSPADYDMGIDTAVAYSGSTSGFIRSNKPAPEGFGTFMQMFDAAKYRGKRLQYSAFVKCENIERWAGLWLRVDKGDKSVAFDNMQNRPIKGTRDWTQFSIVLDVDPMAERIAFGILMDGPGAAWIDEIQFTVVDDNVPVTDMMKNQVSPSGPRNLNFDEK